MKRFLLLLTLFCAMFSTARAVEVEIGDPSASTTTTSTYLPYYTLYNYGWTQEIYTASEIGQAGTINSLTLYLYHTAGASATPTSISIYMQEVSKLSFDSTKDWIPMSAADLVYTGTLDVKNTSAEAYTFELTAPFDYNGTDNLLIAFANNTGSYKSYLTGLVFDDAGTGYCSMYAYRDGNAYDITNPGVTGTRLKKKNVIMLDMSTSGGVVCDKPTDLDVMSVTAHTATLNWAGGSGLYNVEIKAPGADDWSFVLKNTALTTYDLTELVPNSSYQVRVQSVCDGDNTSGYKTANFKTLIGIPYADELATQDDWKKYTGLMTGVLDGSVTLATTTSGWNFGHRTNQQVLGGNHAYINVFGTSVKYWIVSPVIPMEENCQLTFSVALTDYNYDDPIEDSSSQLDDRFVVLVSADSMVTWQVLREWNNSGSEYVYNQIATAGEEIELDLSAYAGQNIQIAFYCESTAAGGDNDLHVGHVLIDVAPSCLKPAHLGEVEGSASKNSIQIKWEHAGAEAFLIQYKKASDENYADPITVTPNPVNGVYSYTLTGLDEFTEYNVRVAAHCDLTDPSTLTDYCKVITVKTASGVPFNEQFNHATWPNDWKRYDALLAAVQSGAAELEGTANGWKEVSKANGNNVFDSAYHAMINIAGESCKYWAVSPTIEMEAGYELSFNLALTKTDGSAVEAGGQPDDVFAVLVYADGAWANLRTWSAASEYKFDEINGTTSGQIIKIDLNAYAGKNIQLAFYAQSTVANGNNNLHIANVLIDLIPACSPALSLDVTDLEATSATLVWTGEDGTWQYGFVANPAADFAPTAEQFTATTQTKSAEMTGLTQMTSYAFFVRRVCDGGYSDPVVRTFTTIQMPAEMPYDNNFESENGWLLINGDLTNKWYWGSAANNTTGGQKALYISDDLGMNNTYSHSSSTVYAMKTFNFAEAGMYTFSFDWIANGEGSYDYLRVALVSLDTEPEASETLPTGLNSTSLPTGWIALDGGSKLNLQTEWQHQSTDLTINQTGKYKMVFVWRNDNSGGDNPAGAIDNIHIARMSCAKPTGLLISEIGNTSAVLAWDEDQDMNWLYAYARADEAKPADDAFVAINQNSISLSDLTIDTEYKFYLRKVCGESASEDVTITFKTNNPYLFMINEGASSSTSYMPFYGYYAEYESDNSQFIVPADSLEGIILWDSIAALTFHTYSATYSDVSWGDARWEVYMAEAPAGTLSDFVDWNAMTKVKEADSMVVVNREMKVNLDYPYQYKGGNLLIGFKQTATGTGASCSWQAKSINGLGYSSYKSSATATTVTKAVRNYLPKLGVVIIPGEAPACPRPSHLAVIDSTITSNSAALDWTFGGAEANWLVQYKKSTDEEWIYATDSVNTHPFTLSGLEASTVYDVRVAAWCGAETSDSTAVSDFTSAISFATLCEPYSIAQKGNYKEGFELYEGASYNSTTGVAPVCWDVAATNSTGVKPHVIAPSDTYAYIHSGEKALTFYGSGYCYAALPEFADSLKFLRISFWSGMESLSNGTLKLGYITNDDPDTFHEIATYESSYRTDMVQHVTDLNNVPDAAARLVFQWYYSSQYSCCIDDIEVMYIPNCLEPVDLEVLADSITTTSAAFTWTAQGEETAWTLQYKKQADEEWISVAAPTDTFTLTGLVPATVYDVRVAAQCSESEISPYSASISFATECLPLTEFPYAEGFDSIAGVTTGHMMPLCWDYINTCTNATYNYYPTVYKSATYANTSANSLKFYSYYSSSASYTPEDQYAILPEMEGISGIRMKFNARANTVSAYYDANFTVGVMTDPADTATFVAIATLAPASTAYEPFVVPFNSYAGQGKYIAIKMAAAEAHQDSHTYGYRGLYIDDIVVEALPNCIEPTGLQVDSVTTNSVILSWTAQNNETAWSIQYKKSAEEDWTTVPANANPFELTGLDAATVYDVKVAAKCGEEEMSAYSNAISFATECDLFAIPFAENFNKLASGIPTCWDNSQGTTTTESYKWNLYISGGDTCLRFNSYTNSSSNYNVLATPIFYLSSNATLTFRWKNPKGGAGEVYIATADTLLLLEDNLTGITNWTPFEFDLSEFTGDTAVIYFLGVSNYGSGDAYLYLDDVAVNMLPACRKVKDVAVSEITATSATLSWKSNSTAWQIAYSADPEFDLAGATLIDIASNPYALAELLPDTLYKVYVRANCGDGEFGEWSDLFTFRTVKSCQTPDGIVASDITISSASISWNTYGQTGFNLRYTADGENWTVITNAELPCVLNELTANTMYMVQVQAACEEADSWSMAQSFKTKYATPFYEPFNASSIPADWSLYNGLMSDVLSGDAELESTTGNWLFGTNNGVFDSHARINIYGTSKKHWLVTPDMFNGANNQLTFDLALTAFSGTAAASGTCDDDKFAVLISTDGGNTWALLREWNNSGSEYVYNNIATAGEEVTIDLSAYANQQIMIAFYGESTVSGNGDNNLHIDNVLVDAIPSCIKPQALAISDVFAHSATLAWTSDAAAWQIALDTIANFKPDTLSSLIDATENPYTLSNLLPAHTYYVYVRANCGEQDGVSVWTARASFTTTVACPAPEGLAAQLTPGNGAIATLTWNAGQAQAWQVEYSLNANMSDSLVVNVTEAQANLTGLTAEATYYARVKADCGELDGESLYSAIISFTPTDKYEIVVNDGTTTNSYVPVYGSYVDNATGTRSQFIIPEAALEEIEWDSIKTLTFYTSVDTSKWGDAQFEVYMMEAPEATMSELADWESMTKVMNSGLLTVSNKKMVVELDELYQYQGGNLMIGIYQTVTSGGDYKAISWYGVRADGASFGGYGNGNQVQQRNFLPKMTIEYVPGQAPACPKAKHLAISEITDNSALASWSAVEGANWEYALVEGSAAPAAFLQTTENSVELSNLADATAYTFYLRKACGEDGNSEMISAAFTTEQHVEALPYAENFEGENYFKFVQAEQANAWVIGNAANNGGEKALYISNDGGTSNAYTTGAASASFATILIDFAERGSYAVSYDWKANGDYDNEGDLELYDYLRVALVPAEAALVAGTPALPEGYIALDNGGLYGAATWQHVALQDVQIYDGLYKLVFAWFNDGADGDQAPAAIDNISIVRTGGMTDIEGGAGIENTAIKFIRNDQVYILLNGTVYTITGQKVEMK